MILVFYIFLVPTIEAISPTFPRQDIKDDVNDLVKLNYPYPIITRINNSDPVEEKIADSIDIYAVTYLSDGKTLNATLWLTRGFNDTLFENKNIMVDFGMYIDVSPESPAGIDGTSSYHKQITWPSNAIIDLPGYVHLKSNSSWIENIHEVAPVHHGGHRYLEVAETRNYTKYFEQLAFHQFTYSIPLSLDLKDINFPQKYRVMFYTSIWEEPLFRTPRIVDYTNWLDVRPPEFFLSTFPNKIEVRPGEHTDITGIVKSTTGSIPNATSIKVIDDRNSIIKVHPTSNVSYVSLSSAVHPATFHIEVPTADKIQAGEYTIPMGVIISTGSPSAPPEFFIQFQSTGNSKGYLDSVVNMTVQVLKPQTFGEWFKASWDVYGQPISIVTAGFAGGATSLIFERFKKKRTSST